jgi:prephenate dehydratase
VAAIYKVDYYHVETPDEPGQISGILQGLKKAKVNLLACCSFPIGDGRSQIDLVPEYDEAFRRAAAKLDLPLSERKRAFLIQGGDRAVAVADMLEKLAARGINVVATQALAAGNGRWAMILWVVPEDYDRAGDTLGF